ncbi:MAG: extracellular solute-binding protein [Lachnospiraceae bacterium]|nr:extracellular solute-binding protein [Lachnospiraceae bacterium]MCI9100031.1 extracellular solute-binding protein [Lachnospiraceae bacterium]
MKRNFIKVSAVLLVGAAVYATAACAKEEALDTNLIHKDQGVEKVVNLFTPVEKSNPNAGNVARTAQEISIMEAEEKLNLRVEYRSYTAEDYKEKTYDDVALDRVRSNMDDVYLLNPDTIQVLGAEGQLADLSGLDNVKNLREVVKAANMVNGKLVAIPQEVVSYGLFVNQDMFDDYDLELPQTPDDLLECCRVFKKNGIETPIGANRWWLENFVLAQAYADLYNGDTTDEEIAALNSGEAKYSDYMRAGFEYLQELIDLEYIDAETAYTYEAIEGEGPDFLAQKTPIVMAYWAAANADTAYGDVDFNLQVIGFPTKLGQMPVVSMNGYGVGVKAEHLEDAMDMMNVLMSDQTLQTYADTNQVISPSKNVEVDCRDALKPLNAKINEGVYVLGSNANMKLEQWGNTCLIVRSLLKGASVDECMAEFDKLQAETLQ